MALSQDEIFEKVRGVLVDALAVDDDEVELESTLVDDLGAESIDLLDIVFQLEKAFEIKIDRSELVPVDALNDPAYVQEGKLTEAGMEMLRKALPYANLDAFAKNPVVQNLAKVLTVKDLVHIVDTKVNAQ
ncbi:MAG: acyl carrier protein [Thermoguttaceae bacterium]|nr:acyl carrier protein [Thermoguttaceae bacterium]MBQ2684593.1 acyl carrier protein [Thermoguttaceae bacterium]MBQ6618646.1 acyl carrier protein [Thermoguttaceae bacterium]MBR3220008.1 acyl carrier protein [Thermoguttaceae bacterium]